MTNAAIPKGYKQTEVGVIPEDWNTAPLGSLTDPRRPISYGIVQTGPNLPNGVRCLRVLDLNEGRINKQSLITTSKSISESYKRTILQTGDLVMPLRGKVGDVAIVDSDLAGCNLTRGVALIAITTNWSAPFCKHFISAPATRARLEQSMNGSALQEIPIATLRAFRVCFPPGKAEQETIAEALSDADALIESLEQLIAKKRQLKQGAMQDLLTGKKRLLGFVGEWQVKRFGDLAAIRNQRAMPSQVDPETPCIELEHIGQASGRLLNYTTGQLSTSSKYRFFCGDVLFGRLRPYLRKYWWANRDGLCSTEIWPLMVDREQAAIGFLHAVVQTDRFIDAASVSYGTHMPRADWAVIQNLEIKLPQVDEQEALAAIINDMDKEIVALENKLAKARSLKQGMMQELLTGRIRLV